LKGRNVELGSPHIEAICELNHDLLRRRLEVAKQGEEESVIEMRRAQLSFGDGLILEEVSDLREDWMERAARVLADEQMAGSGVRSTVEAASQQPSRGRLGAPS
jgi:hypothetical protein